MEKTSVKDCKLKHIKLTESFSKLAGSISKPNVTVALKHEIEFSPCSGENEGDFCLNFNTELTGVSDEKEEIFKIVAKHRACFIIFEKTKFPPETFEEITEVLGYQLFPTIRAFFIDMLLKMDIPPFMPWSVQKAPTEKKKKSNKAKTVKSLT